MTWQVNMEPIIALGGGRALLLQVLHPLVAAGVADHSNFVDEPFRRGFRTADIMLKLAFGYEETSAKQATILRKMHERVKGATYNAMDPALLLWVWATLVDVSLRMYELGVHELSDEARNRYYEEQKEIAYACGVPAGACPQTLQDFERYMDQMISSELHVNRTAELVAYAGHRPPLPLGLGRPAGALVTFLTAGLLPEPFRGELGYAWSPAKQRALDAFFLASRAASRVIPTPLRHLPNRWLTKRRKPLQWWSGRPIEVHD